LFRNRLRGQTTGKAPIVGGGAMRGVAPPKRAVTPRSGARPDLAKAGAYGRLPLSFERNDGQVHPEVAYFGRAPGYALFLTPDGAVLSLQGAAIRSPAGAAPRAAGRVPAPAAPTALRMAFVGAKPAPCVVAEGKLGGTTSYYRGRDPSKWVSGVPSYRRAGYEALYPGIDLR